MAQIKGKSESYNNISGINTKASQYSTGPHEFLNIENMNFAVPGALTKRDGTSLYTGATVTGQVTGLYEFERLSGASFFVAAANTNVYTVLPAGFSVLKTPVTQGALWDFQTFVDRLFAVNGAESFKYDGSNTTNIFLPQGNNGFGVTVAVGGGLSGIFQVSFGYFNNRGYFGPGASAISITLNGSTFGSIQYYGLSTPGGFGISGLAFYRSQADSSNLFLAETHGSTTSYLLTGATTLSSIPEPDYLYLTAVPKYLAIFANQMIYAGFSSMLSTFYISDVGEPEGIPPENSIEVRTNDGDRITGMQPYNGNLVVFKERSFHRLSGDNPQNFVLTEISDQYGCLSNRAIVQYKDYLWFLDRKGIIQFNGSHIDVVSDKIEPIMARMNQQAAKDHATAVHDKLRNQIKFSFPVDGSSVNNMTVVWDYIAEAWTTETGLKPAINVIAKREFTKPTVFFGGYSGTIASFGSSYRSDLGTGITCIVKSRFLADMGNSITKEFRRLYLDCVPVSASSLVTTNFYQDYGSSLVLTRSMYQSPFQSRIDYGIMAKSLSVEFIHGSTFEPCQINGYTIEYRMQRRT